jgi:hypothetical protein
MAGRSSVLVEPRRRGNPSRRIHRDHVRPPPGEPRLFETGRPFSLSAIRTVIDGIKGNRLKVERGEVSRKQVLFLSLDIEKSILESKYQDILKTTDHEYLQMIREITLQTNSHHRQIAHRVERLQD